MDIKASDVKALREKTGAGMLDCKKALVEAGGNVENAVKILKELGLAAAAKRSGRATNEGRIFTLIQGDSAGILELSCETDFVARNSDFIDLGKKALAAVIEKKLEPGASELESMMQDAISTIKENMSLRRFATLDIEKGTMVIDYVHGEGRIGVIVKLGLSDHGLLENEKVKEFAFDCALHLAAFNPLFLTKDKVDSAYLAEQEEIFRKQAENLDKPEKVIEGIIKGKMNKHLSGICFMDQPFVKDDKRSVEKVARDLGKEVGGEVNIVDYIYYRVGEEIG